MGLRKASQMIKLLNNNSHQKSQHLLSCIIKHKTIEKEKRPR